MLNLEGKKILITAGPTYEPIDPVRFIGNRSTGKMGVAITEVLLLKGAFVELVLGPSDLKPEHSRLKVTAVETAAEMFEAVMHLHSKADVCIFAAAVADYTPKSPALEKIKKNESSFLLELIKTKDIAAEAGKIKMPHQIHIGFALETNNELENAQLKLQKKNFDAIVLNSLKDPGAGFSFDTNKITILDIHNQLFTFELKSKQKTAEDIVHYIETYCYEK